ncbi:hypothetical protein [Azonexus sp.]|jgi:hypothetical protein|uniref:hypothetical protein n=1 Tax=Azonexus sp. TaxID=1872668 RepID=UPI002829DC74|nr:hypothetical protein [Azonexus sp.]MDR1996479.1 hypothetical protein [Azonexus sp.]
MTRFRLTIYFFIGILLGTASAFSHAETISASPGPGDVGLGTCTIFTNKLVNLGKTSLEECIAAVEGFSPGGVLYRDWFNFQTGPSRWHADRQYCASMTSCGSWAANTYYNFDAGCAVGSWYNQELKRCDKYVCPPDYDGPKTIGGTPNMCEKKDCLAGELKIVSTFDSWAVCDQDIPGCLTGSVNIPASYCDGSCIYSLGKVVKAYSEKGASVDNPKPSFLDREGTATGSSCTTATNIDPGPPPDIQQKEPPCKPGEGVLTSSSGNVKCVPEGTPGNEPEVKNTKKQETYPDGSTKDTETTETKDPGSGATHTETKTTNTPGPGGGTQSGTPGTTTSSGPGGAGAVDGAGNGNGDKDGDKDGDGECDPKSEMCDSPDTGGLYEKKGKDFKTVFSNFSNGVQSSGVGKAMTDFFTVSTPSGGCPNWSVTVPYIDVTLNGADYFCNATALMIMQGVGALLMLVASIVGFRWAFL